MIHKHLKTARMVAWLMDNQFSLFGIRFGLDGLVGLIPGFGDLLSLGFSAYLIWIALTYRLPANQILRMIINVVIDLLVGSIPLVGDISDVFIRVNMKNLKILEEFVNQKYGGGEVVEGEIISEKSKH